jgi:GST-like protein
MDAQHIAFRRHSLIELHSWPTPNGQKVHIALEELALPYRVVPVDIGAGEQFSPQFLALNPNHRIPAICLQWLMFQMGGVGPMFGQANHFANYAPEKIPYAIDRYRNEAIRLLRVLEKRLSEAKFLAGKDYSIADIATYPWIKAAAATGHFDLGGTPAVADWMEGVAARPAVERGMAVLADRRRQGPMSDQERDVLFGAKQNEPR